MAVADEYNDGRSVGNNAYEADDRHDVGLNDALSYCEDIISETVLVRPRGLVLPHGWSLVVCRW